MYARDDLSRMGKLVGLGTPKLGISYKYNRLLLHSKAIYLCCQSSSAGADSDVHVNAHVFVGFDGCQTLRCRSYVEYAAEQCQARVNSLVEALTEQGRTILTEVTTILKTFST